MLDVDVGSGQKGVDAFFGCRLNRRPRLVNVIFVGSGQCRNDWTIRGTDFFGDLVHCGPVARGCSRKSRFDDVNAEPMQLPRNLQLFVEGHGAPWRLFTIA